MSKGPAFHYRSHFEPSVKLTSDVNERAKVDQTRGTILATAPKHKKSGTDSAATMSARTRNQEEEDTRGPRLSLRLVSPTLIILS